MTAAPTAMPDVAVVDGWLRTVVRTPWLTDRDDLGGVLAEHVPDAVGDALRPTDVIAIAEKVAVVTSGRAVPIGTVRPGPLARLLARAVRPVGDSKGLSIPEKMQFVLAETGRARVVFAAAVAALVHPFGRTGVFYRLAGPLARDLDGGRDGYEGTLLPPITPGEASLLARHLANRLGAIVAIVDVNDRGGTVRGTSAPWPDAAHLLQLLADNPHGHADASTPVVVLRRRGS